MEGWGEREGQSLEGDVGDLPTPGPELSLFWQNGSNTRCQVVRCHLGWLAKGAEVSVGLLRLVHNEFFRKVNLSFPTGPPPPARVWNSSVGFGGTRAHVQVPVSPLTSCWTLSKLFHLSKLLSSHL